MNERRPIWPNNVQILSAPEPEDLQPAHGISISQAATGTIPEPTHRLEWGEDMPPEIREALRQGETAMQYKDGKPNKLILMDYFGTIRERRVDHA